MRSPGSREIRRSMQDVFRSYSSLRDEKSGNKTPFWDAVVLTTFDEAQRVCFLEQVQRKRASGQLPEVPIYVVADPPGQKLGVGGSTLHVLSELSTEFGSELYSKKLLIIHSGGSSQRLPSYSVLGKIFAPVPVEGLRVGNAVPQMLDLKLALYLPLCSLLGPGTLVTCADDIETYCLDRASLDMESLGGADVVALGHPSTLEVGTGHGVYVLQGGGAEVALSGTSSVQECLEVLQKPSISAMRASGAVFCRGGSEQHQDQQEEQEGQEEVWSDSVFWLSSGVCRRLLKWYRDNQPLPAELDAYAHLLPCLGTRMVAASAEDFSDFRSQMLPLVRGASFKVITLPQSKFYHLGTMQEYVGNFNTAQDFISELGIDRNTSNIRGSASVECLVKEGHGEGKEAGEDTVKHTRMQGTIIESYFSSPDVRIEVQNTGTRYVIEHCRIGVTLRLSGDTILSNCTIVPYPAMPHTPGTAVHLPAGTLFHTVPVTYQAQSLYITVAFDLDARMKAESSDLRDVRAFGRTLKDVIHTLGLEEVKDMGKISKISLWNVNIFPAAKTASESFWLTHAAVCKVMGVSGGPDGVDGALKGREEGGDGHGNGVGCDDERKWFSMKDVVEMKDLNTLLEDRTRLVMSIRDGEGVTGS
uniref:GDP-fucose pyrophosphorylase domain-containing protein n=2 Tax=Scylla olivacea TaxID=85551 RepID=A0A0P4WAQ6_SCYOL